MLPTLVFDFSLPVPPLIPNHPIATSNVISIFPSPPSVCLPAIYALLQRFPFLLVSPLQFMVLGLRPGGRRPRTTGDGHCTAPPPNRRAGRDRRGVGGRVERSAVPELPPLWFGSPRPEPAWDGGRVPALVGGRTGIRGGGPTRSSATARRVGDGALDGLAGRTGTTLKRAVGAAGLGRSRSAQQGSATDGSFSAGLEHERVDAHEATLQKRKHSTGAPIRRGSLKRGWMPATGTTTGGCAVETRQTARWRPVAGSRLEQGAAPGGELVCSPAPGANRSPPAVGRRSLPCSALHQGRRSFLAVWRRRARGSGKTSPRPRRGTGERGANGGLGRLSGRSRDGGRRSRFAVADGKTYACCSTGWPGPRTWQLGLPLVTGNGPTVSPMLILRGMCQFLTGVVDRPAEGNVRGALFFFLGGMVGGVRRKDEHGFSGEDDRCRNLGRANLRKHSQAEWSMFHLRTFFV